MRLRTTNVLQCQRGTLSPATRILLHVSSTANRSTAAPTMVKAAVQKATSARFCHTTRQGGGCHISVSVIRAVQPGSVPMTSLVSHFYHRSHRHLPRLEFHHHHRRHEVGIKNRLARPTARRSSAISVTTR